MKFVSDAVLEGYISEDSVLEALRRVRKYVQGLPDFEGKSFERGYMKGYGLFPAGKPANQRPYDFAVNKGSLKCYVRKPGLTALGPVRQQLVLRSFPAAEMLNGELRVNLYTPAEVDELLRCLFEQ